MKIEKSNTDTMLISDIDALDPVTVFFEDYGENRGRLSIVCYGKAWTAYWGSMGSSLKEFVRDMNYDYIAGKLYDNSNPCDNWIYLCRIVKAVQEALKTEQLC